ncbi:DUF885 domain-containing protein [Oceanicoccus sagamiensis]|uniref:DUF885 domain-containing protein n=1 Tax=Oceanicoccus sagamiensis TaxID=716816 RepID=A0A1X9NG29_9GAMM|nr:DUF885 domain-containing protein [Oceanicoccus sagamiensis]ARN72963.1 hypothetical protein BST96_01880 [Oceanicoccus sagamiensis]
MLPIKILTALLALILLPGCEQTQQQPASDQEQELTAFFASSYQQTLSRSPMTQTYRGIKDNYGQWDNLSDSFAQESEAIKAANLETINSFEFYRLNPDLRLSAELFQYVAKRNQRYNNFRHHSYIMQQFSGWHTQIPSFLINMHQVSSQADAEAYITRLYGVQTLLDQVIEQLTIREQLGIFPPKWSYPQMLDASNNVLQGQPFDNSDSDSAILADFRAKVEALDIDTEIKQLLIKDAQAALLNSLLPGYQSLINTLTAQMALASDNDGVWKHPNGDDYYTLLLNTYTTTDLTAGEIHQIGRKQVARIHAEMREIMHTVGFKGDLQAFFKFMREDPQFYYPNNAQGRELYLSEAKRVLAVMEEKLPQTFGLLPKARLKIKAVEAFREKTAGKAFYQSPAQDGSRPGIYYANLYDMNSMPIYQLEALAYHEGLPGHHMQLAITVELEDVPEFQKYARFTAFTEGWGLYSEYLAKEMGAYQDPYSDFGRLAMDLWRACRLVVDTGIHAKRWDKQKAIDYLVENTPNAKEDATKAIERYIVYPGQATAYMIGKMKILALRETARQQLGEQFDIRDFHDQVLKDGPMPLTLLDAKIQRWVAQVQRQQKIHYPPQSKLQSKLQ